MSDSYSSDVEIPPTSPSRSSVIMSSSPLKDDEPKKFQFKPSLKKGIPSPSPSSHTLTKNSAIPEDKLQRLLNEYPDFSTTLVQAVFKSNSFDMDLARGRLNRIKNTRKSWSGSGQINVSLVKTNAGGPKTNTTRPLYGNVLRNNNNNNFNAAANGNTSTLPTRRFDSLNHTASTKITLNKPKTSIFDRYSNVINKVRKFDNDDDDGDEDDEDGGIHTSKRNFNFESPQAKRMKRKLVRGDHFNYNKPISKPTELDNAKNKILKLKAQRLMETESDSEADNHSNDEDVDDDDDGADYEEASVGPVDLDTQILKFLNEANQLDLADLADTTFEKAQVVISKRPFNSLVLFADMDFLTEEEIKKKELENSPSPGKSNRKRNRYQRKDGDKFLEKIGESIKGYNAIDSLLKKCSSYGTMISNQIGRWGVDIEKGGNGKDAEHDDSNETGLQLMTVDDDDDDKTSAVVEDFDESIKTETTSDNTVLTEVKKETDKVKIEEVDSDEEVEEVHESEVEDDEDYMEDGDVDMDDDEEDDDDEDEDENVSIVQRSSNNKAIRPNRIIKFFRGKPRLLSSDISLKDYQQMGVNWLNLLYQNGMSCILADDMGLGKTCQVISFLAYLKQINEPGPHLIVVPSSTLENWLREFKKFCPSLKIEPYYGSLNERADLRDMLESAEGQYDVIVSTYNLAAGNKYDVSFLRNRKFNVVVYDEGHMLKNSMSDRFNKLMKIRGNFRLLLTGTPLQNNLRELMSLLEFIMPNLFISKKDSLATVFKQKAKTSDNNKDHNPLLVQNAIERARTMMKPFILRRKKDQVLKHLPAKHNKVVLCEMAPTQREIYDNEIRMVKEQRRARLEALKNNDEDEGPNDKKKKADAAKKKQLDKTSKNLIMTLRKASIHPLMFRNIFSDKIIDRMSRDILREPAYAEDGNREYIREDMSVMTDFELHKLCLSFPDTLAKYQLKKEEWMDAGKINKLKEILEDVIVVKKEKILIFSLFTQVLDILESVLSTLKYKFLRLDGSTQVNERQSLIDTFYEDDTIPVFILSTKAGGFGINLVCANHVVIFDQSFNPHDDRQAADRAHRVGQTKEVTISTLIMKNSIEENIHELAKNKLALDSHISEDDKKSQTNLDNQVNALLEDIILKDEDPVKSESETVSTVQ